MLQQILKDMYIEPDVLDALNEEQKKTLFLKMRQEQVRRWKEREEKLEREGRDAESKSAKPRKANSKSVSWLPGRDGDVSVNVIGDVDELTAKFISSGFVEKKSPNLQNNITHKTILKSKNVTEDVETERENLPPKTQPGISLNLKGKCEGTSTSPPLPVSVSEHATAAPKEKLDLKSSGANEEKSVPQPSTCSRANLVNVRSASAKATLDCANKRPEPRLATTAPSPSPNSAVRKESGSTTATKSSSNEPQKPHGSQSGKDTGVSEASRRPASDEAGTSRSAPTCAGRGRVAQLMKTFSVDTPTQTPPRGNKPPLPTKPSHLRRTTSSTIR
ncbi:uncharacterized protein PAE49_017768 [Odontesthes bonariensis]|uniref:uncharacterized protein LOC142402163 n=1 Tax=Odontesthes bonariensis TaxID=219752 RepID=UPI003F58EE6A